MEQLAAATGGLDELLEVMARDQSSGYAYLRIAEACRAHGRDDLALDWAERGRAAFPGELRLVELVMDLHAAAGRHAKALDAARELFTRAPSLDAYRQLRSCAEASDARGAGHVRVPAAGLNGPRPWRPHADRRSTAPSRGPNGHGQVWSHWDRWFALVALVDHGGDLAGVATAFDDRVSGYLGEDAQAKLAHLDDLTVRLAAVGIDPAGLCGDDEVDKTVLAKARRKVVTQALSGRDLTGPMRHPPRRQLRARALRGSWPVFPADPADPYRLLAELVEDRTDIWARRSFELVRDLEAVVAGLVDDAGDDPARELAVRRAALTAVAEAAERADDSYGEIGRLGLETWQAYVATPWRDLLDPATYWRDVCELVAFDDYAHLHQYETLPFRRARTRETNLLVGLLDDLADEYTAARLRWHADETRQASLYVLVATRSYDRFVDAASGLGSGHWRPVALLAETALAAGRRDIAAAVFDAADQPGHLGDHLRKLRHQMLGGGRSNGRHLRAVASDDP